MIEGGDILLEEADVGTVNLHGAFFPSDFTDADLGCSSLGVSTTFSELSCGPGSFKRCRTEDEVEEQQLQELQSEVKRLKENNILLQASFDCIHKKTISAVGEQKKLLQLVKALHHHKQAFQMRPLESQASSIGSSGTEIAEDLPVVEEDPTETFLSFQHSPSRSQPGPAEPFLTPCKDDRRVQSAALPSNRVTCGEAPSRLPSRLEADPRTAHAAAIAAAALSVNAGNPAAALMDLLHLAMTKQQEQNIPPAQSLWRL